MSHGQARVGPVADLGTAIDALEPSDELILNGGKHLLPKRFSFDIAGTEATRIVIRTADGKRPHPHRLNADFNTINIVGAEHVVPRWIEFADGSPGIRITVQDCEIHDAGIRANDTGVTYESLRMIRNHIHNSDKTPERR